MWPAFLWASLSLAGGATEARYVGATACRLCHRAIFLSWEATPHARASASIPEADVGADFRCLSCHATNGREVPDVQCEACHGPGGNYWPAEVMMDPDKAELAGLVWPDEAACRECHDNDEPGHRDGFVMPGPAEIGSFVHRVPEP